MRAGSVQATGKQKVGLKGLTGKRFGPTKAGRSWVGAESKEVVVRQELGM